MTTTTEWGPDLRWLYMEGPSLVEVWNAMAGLLAEFHRDWATKIELKIIDGELRLGVLIENNGERLPKVQPDVLAGVHRHAAIVTAEWSTANQ